MVALSEDLDFRFERLFITLRFESLDIDDFDGYGLFGVLPDALVDLAGRVVREDLIEPVGVVLYLLSEVGLLSHYSLIFKCARWNI